METEKKQALLHGEPEQPPPQEHAKVRRRKWCTPTRFGCAASVLALGAVALPLRHSDDLLNCDRQCRWYLGFFERDIHGARNGSDHCSCVRVDATTGQRAPLGQVPYHTTAYAFEGPPTVPPTPFSRADCCVEGAHTPLTNCTPTGRCHGNVYPYAKPFDATAWADKYETAWVCVLGAGEAVPSSVQQPPAVHAACAADGDADAHAHATCQGWKASVEAHGARILHCGVCSSCSSPHDLHVLNATKADITTHMTACSTKYVVSQRVPFGRQSLADLKTCLIRQGIDFSDDGRAWAQPANKPTCMDTWVDNILNDAALCVASCWSKFVHSANGGDFARSACLQCDEYTSGPAFIKGAGANRRSTGITSDIDRTQLRGTRWEQKICKVGFFSPQ